MTRVVRVTPRNRSWILRSDELFDHPSLRAAVDLYLRDSANVFFLAIEDGRGIGFLRGTSLRQLHTLRRQMFLYEIAVLVRYRRRGVARALVEALLGYCRRRRFEEMFVFTSPRNRPAVNLYRSTGGVTETVSDRMFVYHVEAAGPPHRSRRTPETRGRPPRDARRR